VTSLYDFHAETLQGADKALEDFRGQVLLIVNTASQCGFTPQYAGLEHLYQRHRAAGFTVLGFPCNQFGKQEPGDAAQIGAFCQANYGVRFPMFAKIDVNGPDAHPLYRFLTRARRGLLGTASIKWNFTKFLADRAGNITARYSPLTKPDALDAPLARLLAARRNTH
jgi:glutathione peroxidase